MSTHRAAEACEPHDELEGGRDFGGPPERQDVGDAVDATVAREEHHEEVEQNGVVADGAGEQQVPEVVLEAEDCDADEDERERLAVARYRVVDVFDVFARLRSDVFDRVVRHRDAAEHDAHDA